MTSHLIWHLYNANEQLDITLKRIHMKFESDELSHHQDIGQFNEAYMKNHCKQKLVV